MSNFLLIWYAICQVHSILNHQTAIPSSHSIFLWLTDIHQALHTSISTISLYRYSFFINSPFLWNNVHTCQDLTDNEFENIPWCSQVLFFNLVLHCVYLFCSYCLFVAFVSVCCYFVYTCGEHVCRPSLLCN